MFTGKAVYKPGSIAELLKAHEESELSNPSQVIDDMDPLVERTILRCLEKNPAERPKSAHTVAAALPGGDPLAAALAAGETPSPEMVAAAGDSETVSPKIVGVCLAVVALGLVLCCWMGQRTQIVNRLKLKLSSDSLEDKAQEWVEHLGYPKRADDASGLIYIDSQKKAIETGHTPVLNYWYRQSPKPLFMNGFWGEEWGKFSYSRVNMTEPPWSIPGETGLRLSPDGLLCFFRAVPPDTNATLEKKKPWSEWFTREMIGFDLDDPELLQPASPQRTPPVAYDQIQAWKGHWPETTEPLFVEAALYRGKPVYFNLESRSDAATPRSRYAQLRDDAILWFTILMRIGAILLVWRNLKSGRCDRRGAFRIAAFAFVVTLLTWIILANHLSSSSEWTLLTIALGQALFSAALIWVLYIAFEPFLRRIWPQILTSWTRLLEGRWKDARVGSDLLLGVMAGVLSYLALNTGVLASLWLDCDTALISPYTWSTRGGLEIIPQILTSLFFSIRFGLSLLTLLLILRIVLRSERMAAVGWILIWITMGAFGKEGDLWVSLITNMLLWGFLVWLLTRYGLLVLMTVSAVFILLSNNPFTPDKESMFFTDGVLAIVVVVGLALYGAYHALGGRALFRDSKLFAE